MRDQSLRDIFDARQTMPEFGREYSFWSRPDGKLFLQHFQPTQTVSYEPHTHSEYHVVVCLEGAVTKTQMGHHHVIEAGESIMGNFGVEHASSYRVGSRGSESVCLSVDRRMMECFLPPSLIVRDAGQRVPVFLGRLQSQALLDCARDVATELRERRPGYELVVDGLAMRMLVEAMRMWPAHKVEMCDVDWTPRLPRRDFVRAYEFMRWCRKDEFRLDQLSRLLGTSEVHFARLFRAAAKESPASFFNRLLLHRSVEMLRDRSLSVKEVGYELGFKTSSHFVAVFRREFGTTPQGYRMREVLPQQN